MKFVSLLLFSVLVSLSSLAQTIYYDSEWNELPSKKDASFYREIEKRQDTFFVKDFYISGQTQMSGAFLDKELTVKHGLFTFFFPTGQRQSEATYDNGIKNLYSVIWDEDGNKYNKKSPEFPGGNEALMTFLANEIQYPEYARENGIEGCVVVQLLVEPDGSPILVKVTNSVSPSLTEEAIRVISKMPKWIPATLNGEPAPEEYMLPIYFKLR